MSVRHANACMMSTNNYSNLSKKYDSQPCSVSSPVLLQQEFFKKYYAMLCLQMDFFFKYKNCEIHYVLSPAIFQQELFKKHSYGLSPTALLK